MKTCILLLAAAALPLHAAESTAGVAEPFRLLATNKTSTMQKELNEAARAGYRFAQMMAGETLGGDELVTVMHRKPNTGVEQQFEYRVVATSKTSTMQKELSEWGQEGYRYVGQSVAETAFGGREVIVVVERPVAAGGPAYDYRLQATKRTKTMGEELNEVGREGFELMGLTVSATTFGGKELVTILMREAQR